MGFNGVSEALKAVKGSFKWSFEVGAWQRAKPQPCAKTPELKTIRWQKWGGWHRVAQGIGAEGGGVCSTQLGQLRPTHEPRTSSPHPPTLRLSFPCQNSHDRLS